MKNKNSIVDKNKIVPKDTIVSDSTKTSSLISKDAIKQQVDYACEDSMLFAMKDQKIYMYGKGTIKSEEMNLDADLIEIDTDKSYITAKGAADNTGKISGKPVFKQGVEEFKAEEIKYSFKTKNGIVKDVITKQEGGYLHGSTTKMHANKEVHIYDGKYTTCDLDHPHFYVELTKAKIIPGKRIVSGPMYFVIADIPLPLFLPFGYIPSQNQTRSGILIPQYGEEDKRGFFLRNGGYYWAINPSMDLAITLDGYTQGGWGTNVVYRFMKKYRYNGNFNFKYNRNVVGEPETKGYSVLNTFWLTGTYAQDSKSNPTQSFSMSLNFGSSKHNQYEATNIDQLAQNSTSSSINYTKRFAGTPFSMNMNVNANQNLSLHDVSLTAPTLSLNMERQYPFKRKNAVGKTRWYEKINVNFNTDFQNTITTKDTLLFRNESLNQFRYGLTYKVPITTSFSIFKYINVTPAINYTGRVYPDYISKSKGIQAVNGEIHDVAITDTIAGFGHPYDFSFSLPFNTKLYGTVNFRKGKIKALRHVMSPTVGFSYRPNFEKSYWDYYKQEPLDTTGTQFYSRYYGVYDYPRGGKSGLINFTLGNSLEMKVNSKKDTTGLGKKIKIFESLNFNTAYNLAADSIKWSPIVMTGGTKLFEKINLTFTASFDPYLLDSLGKKIEKYEWKENHRFARITNATTSLSASLNPSAKSKSTYLPTYPAYYYLMNPEIPYIEFDVPWNLNISYNLTYTKTFETITQTYKDNLIQTTSLQGSLTLTKKLKLNSRADYEFKNNKFTYVDISITRDLHCWQMSLFVVPYGYMRSYNFRLNIKSAIFQGIEYKKQKARLDN